DNHVASNSAALLNAGRETACSTLSTDGRSDIPKGAQFSPFLTGNCATTSSFAARLGPARQAFCCCCWKLSLIDVPLLSSISRRISCCAESSLRWAELCGQWT